MATSTGRFIPVAPTSLFADGSVRFIKELVGFSIFQAIATRAGGEVLSADHFEEDVMRLSLASITWRDSP